MVDLNQLFFPFHFLRECYFFLKNNFYRNKKNFNDLIFIVNLKL